MHSSSPISTASPFPSAAKHYEAPSPVLKTPAAPFSHPCILADCTPVTATPVPSPFPIAIDTPDSSFAEPDDAPLFSLSDLAPPLDSLLLTESATLPSDYFLHADKENRPPVAWNPRHVAVDLREGFESPLVVVTQATIMTPRSARAPLRDITESYRSPHRNVSVNLWRVAETSEVVSPVPLRRTRSIRSAQKKRRALASRCARPSMKRASVRMMR